MAFEYIGALLEEAVQSTASVEVRGRVEQVVGTIIRAVVPGVKVGELCILRNPWEDWTLRAEVVGFVKQVALLTPLGDLQGISPATEVIPTGEIHSVPVGEDLLGRVLNGLGDPIDGGPPLKPALRHTLEIFVFIFVFSLVFGLIVEGVGEDVFASVLGRMGFFQPVVAALVGLVPNCAASVLMTQLYVEGALRFSSLVAGLCTGAGVGLAVLWRVNPSWKQNLFITGLTWACGAAVGVGIQIVVAFIA